MDKRLFIVRTAQDAEQVIKWMAGAPRFAFDTETDGLNITTLNCAGFSVVTEDVGVYFPLQHRGCVCCPSDVAWGTLQKLVSSVVEVYMHNAAFDMAVAKKYGVTISDYQIRDTLAAAKMLNLFINENDEDDEEDEEAEKVTKSNALKPLVEMLFDYHAPTLEEITGNRPTTLFTSNLVGPYCISDAFWTLKLGDLLEEKLRKQGMYKAWVLTECPFIGVICEMQSNGFKIDTSILKEAEKDILPKIKEIEKRIHSVAGYINPGSSPDILGLFKKGILDEKYARRKKDKKTGVVKITGDKICLSWFAAHSEKIGPVQSQLAKDILEWRSLTKVISTYTTPIPEKLSEYKDSRLRCGIDATRTYRLSSSGPNMQNIPSRGVGSVVRKAFVVEEGNKQVNIDFSQVELRVAGHLANDKNLLSVYCLGKDGKGNGVKDLHAFMLNKINELTGKDNDRRIAKNVNFGFLNQQSAEAFSIMYDIPLSEAEVLREAFFKSYLQLDRYYRLCENRGMERRYVTLMNGARRFFRGDKRERIQMSNTPIQGNAALCMKHAMINTLRVFIEKDWLNKLVWIVMSVHDEGIYEAKEEIVKDIERMVKTCFETTTYYFGLKVPLLTDVKIGNNWAESH